MTDERVPVTGQEEGRALIVGTAGHVDHGKTTLVRGLTGIETDRWREERERGLTIDLGFAPLPREATTGLEIGVVDVPGHEDFVKNMLAGATGVDLLLLVVAADEGPMPQTREHLLIAHLLGVRAGVVALTKIDRVDEEWLELARETVLDELRLVIGRDDWPVVPVSAPGGIGLDALRRVLLERAGTLGTRPGEDLFRMPVDRSFSVAGAGTVVTGTTWSGRVRVGDEIRLLPCDVSARVRSLQVHGQDRPRVGPGRRCALALVGVDADDVTRGETAVRGSAWKLVTGLGARLVVPGCLDRPLERGQRVRVYLGTREVMARLELERETLAPGEEGWARLRLERPLVARSRDRFVLRFYSPVTTVGGGRVAELDPPAPWRERKGLWAMILDGSPEDAMTAACELAGGRGLSVGSAPLVTGLPSADTERAAEVAASIVRIGERWYAAGTVRGCREALLEALGRLHRRGRRSSAASLAALRREVDESRSRELIDGCLDDLVRAGGIVVDGPRVRLPGHRAQLTDAEQSAREALLTAVTEAGLEPPMVADLVERAHGDEALLHDLLELLVEERSLVAVSPDLYVSAPAESSLRAAALGVLQRTSPAQASDFKEVLGVSRRYLIPYLQHLDANHVTRRTADGRVPGPEAQSR